jgi:hypothetical protein
MDTAAGQTLVWEVAHALPEIVTVDMSWLSQVVGVLALFEAAANAAMQLRPV